VRLPQPSLRESSRHDAKADPKRICVIFNPTARGEGARRALRHLDAVKGGCTLKPSLAAGMAGPLAAEAVREGFGTIVAMGGDGTVHEVLNGMAAESQGLARARLGVLPVGTVNVFARELGVPFRFDRAWGVICRGREVTIDLPRVSYQTPRGTEERFFAQMAGCGLDARAVEMMDWHLKKKIGQFAYVVSGLKALRKAPDAMTVNAGGQVYRGALVLLGNGRLYGGPIPVFREADFRDGLLDVCVFPKVNWFVILRYACAYLSPKLLFQGKEHYFQAPTVAIESATPVPVELDGELVGHLPVRGTVRQQVLRVVVP
jgi:YegS/Rv2252/BmrU family lipid kinase